jgi:hypothetical protein
MTLIWQTFNLLRSKPACLVCLLVLFRNYVGVYASFHASLFDSFVIVVHCMVVNCAVDL